MKINEDTQLGFAVGAGCLLAVSNLIKTKETFEPYELFLECRDYIAQLIDAMLSKRSTNRSAKNHARAIAEKFRVFVSKQLLHNIKHEDLSGFADELLNLYSEYKHGIEILDTIDYKAATKAFNEQEQYDIWHYLVNCIYAAWSIEKLLSWGYRENIFSINLNAQLITKYKQSANTFIGTEDAPALFDNEFYQLILRPILILRLEGLREVPIPFVPVGGSSAVNIYIQHVNTNHISVATNLKAYLTHKEFIIINIGDIFLTPEHSRFVIFTILSQLVNLSLEGISLFFSCNLENSVEEERLKFFSGCLYLMDKIAERKINNWSIQKDPATQHLNQPRNVIEFVQDEFIIDLCSFDEWATINFAELYELEYVDTEKYSIHILNVMYEREHIEKIKNILHDVKAFPWQTIRISFVRQPQVPQEDNLAFQLATTLRSMPNANQKKLTDASGKPLELIEINYSLFHNMQRILAQRDAEYAGLGFKLICAEQRQTRDILLRFRNMQAEKLAVRPIVEKAEDKEKADKMTQLVVYNPKINM